jgi:hypothetical protein
MYLPLVITFPDHPEREALFVTAGPRDQLKWERAKKGRSLGDLLTVQVKIDDLYSLAHIAATREKKYTSTLEVLESEADVEMGRRNDSDEDPTQEAPSTADS